MEGKHQQQEEQPLLTLTLLCSHILRNIQLLCAHHSKQARL